MKKQCKECKDFVQESELEDNICLQCRLRIEIFTRLANGLKRVRENEQKINNRAIKKTNIEDNKRNQANRKESY